MDKNLAVIFDMDGVISDTQKLHASIESEIFGRFGINITPEEITRQYAGTVTRELFEKLLSQQDASYDVDELLAEKWQRMTSTQTIEAIEGATELIQKLHDANVKMAVASASPQMYVKHVLESLGVDKFFGALISSDMVTKGKPDPEVFLLAASRLGADPKICVVIEDGVHGMEGAKRGGMKCIGLVKSKEEKYPTENLVLSLDEVTFEYLENLK